MSILIYLDTENGRLKKVPLKSLLMLKHLQQHLIKKLPQSPLI